MSKCIRGIVEAGKKYNEDEEDWAKEHETNGEIRRDNGIPTLESKLQGGKLCNFHRWATARSSAYLNDKNKQKAEVEHLSTQCERAKRIIQSRKQNNVLNEEETRRYGTYMPYVKKIRGGGL